MTIDMERIGLFPGSFDPFTIGHDLIVHRALSLFDRVVVAIGVNEGKRQMFSLEERKAAIEQLYVDESRISVATYEGLTSDFALSVGATHIIRGLRSAKDYEYERDMAIVNRRLAGIETIFLYTDPQYTAISSSLVRELIGLGKDVEQFLPHR